MAWASFSRTIMSVCVACSICPAFQFQYHTEERNYVLFKLSVKSCLLPHFLLSTSALSLTFAPFSKFSLFGFPQYCTLMVLGSLSLAPLILKTCQDSLLVQAIHSFPQRPSVPSVASLRLITKQSYTDG